MKTYSEDIFLVKLIQDSEETSDISIISQKLKEYFDKNLLPCQILDILNLKDKKREHTVQMSEIF